MKKRSYEVTGATGHVGKVVADKLGAQGHEVRAVSRSAGADLDNAVALNRASTRRQMIGGMAMGLASLAMSITPAGAPSGADASIHQEVDFKASPERIYEALLDEKQFRAFSGAAAQIQREAGGAFKLIGGRVTGRNVELIPLQRIIQAWRVETWPSGVYSIVRFELTAQGSGTRIVFDHTGFLPEDREGLSGGWSKKYWDPLRKYLEL